MIERKGVGPAQTACPPRQDNAHHSPLEGESASQGRQPAGAPVGGCLILRLRGLNRPPRPSAPCLRRGLFLARPRKRPKKKGAAQTPRGLLFRELPLWCNQAVVPSGRFGRFWAKCLGDLRGKAPSPRSICVGAPRRCPRRCICRGNPRGCPPFDRFRLSLCVFVPLCERKFSLT